MIGKTKFELTDARNGDRQVFTQHNMVTNTASNVLNGMNAHLYHPLQSTPHLWDVINSCMPLYDKVFGGLLLFGNTLTESANTVFPSGNTDVIGAASTGYSGVSSWRGTLNENESGVMYDGLVAVGYRYVWDFGTDKANGTIRSAALTNPLSGSGGIAGIESATEDECTIMSSIIGDPRSLLPQIFEGRIVRVHGDDIYYIDSYSGNKIYKKSVFSTAGIHFTQAYTDLSDATLVRSYDYSISNATIMPNGDIAVIEIEADNAAFVTHVISVADWSSTDYNTPFTDATLYSAAAKYYDGDKLYLVGTRGVTVLDFVTGDVLYTSATTVISSPSLFQIFTIGNYVVFTTTSTVSSGGQKGIAVRRSDNTVSYVNAPVSRNDGASYGRGYWYFSPVSCDDILSPYMLISRHAEGNSSSEKRNYLYYTLLPGHILTIQNLTSDITKTNAQTMKVTYEITEDLAPETT